MPQEKYIHTHLKPTYVVIFIIYKRKRMLSSLPYLKQNRGL